MRKFVNTEDLFNWLYSELRTFTRIFEIYLCICVNGTLDKSSRISLFTDIKPNRLLSFNYTTTYQDVYNASIPKDFIHGKAFLCDNKENCNLVLGFDDHYFDSADTISELIPFEKYYQRIVYRNTNQFFEWVDEKDKNGQPEEKEIYFFGHSLSPADGDVKKLLIECENAKTKIYYRKSHQEERASMIKNLAIILTPNGLIKRMGGVHPTIQMIPI